jgi:hypothetical protein
MIDVYHNHIIPEGSFTSWCIPSINSGLATSDPRGLECTTLNKYRVSLHLSLNLLDSTGWRSVSYHELNNWYFNKLRHVSNLTSSLLENRPYTSPSLLLGDCKLELQVYAQTVLVCMTFWSVDEISVQEIGKPLFERTLHDAFFGSSSCTETNRDGLTVERLQQSIRDINYDFPSLYSLKTYDDDAEENAHELIKEILSKKKFELYRDEGYVTIKGTKGRVYKVVKGEMIQIKQKYKGKSRSYEICIEPRDRGTVCPTDEVIAKIKLIESSEDLLHKVGNTFSYGEENTDKVFYAVTENKRTIKDILNDM